RLYVKDQKSDRMEQTLRSLREVAAKFPAEPQIQQLLLFGLTEIARHYEAGRDGPKIKQLNTEVEAISKRFPSDAAIAWLFTLTLNAAIRINDTNSDQGYFRLRSLASRFPKDEKVQAELIGGMGNRMNNLYRNRDKRIFDEIEPNLITALEIGKRVPASD